jgi:hypothetical protein
MITPIALGRNRSFGFGGLVLAALWLLAAPAPAQPYVWNNAAGGPWQTPGNWTPNGIPSGSDTATIGISTSSSVTMTGATAIGTLTINNAGATLDTSTQSFTVNTSLSLQAGTLITSGATSLVSAATTWTTSAGNNWNWTAGTLAGAGTYTNGGTLTMSVTSSAPNFSSALVNNGTFVWNGSAAIFTQTGASISNSGLFNIRADGTVVQNNMFNAPFTNTGTIRKSLGSGISTIQASLTSTSGVIDVQVGTLTFAGGGTVSGSISVAAGASAFLGGLTLGNTLTGSGTGAVNVNTTTIAAGGATLNFPGSQLQWTNDSINGGVATISAGTTLTVSTSNGHRLNTIITNNGTITDTGTGPIQLNTSSGITNNGLFDVQLDSAGVFLRGDVSSSIAITNTGTFRKSVTTGTSSLAANFVNNAGGTVAVKTGILTIGTAPNPATTPPDPGTSFTFNGASNLEITGGNSSNTQLNLPFGVTRGTGAVLTIKVNDDQTLIKDGLHTYNWTVITGGTATGFTSNLSSITQSAFAVAGGNVTITNASVSISGNNVVIQFTPVPEPPGLLLAGGAVWAVCRRRAASAFARFTSTAGAKSGATFSVNLTSSSARRRASIDSATSPRAC